MTCCSSEHSAPREAADDSGAAYLFDPSAGAIAHYCRVAPNSSGNQARMDVHGSLSVAGTDTKLIATGAAHESLGLFLYSAGPTQLPFGDGYLCVSPFAPGLFRLYPPSPAGEMGDADHDLDFRRFDGAGQITAGSTWHFQYWFRDLAAGGTGFNLSEGLRITFCP